MPVLNLTIPNELAEALSSLETTDLESAVIEAIRQYVSLHTPVSKDDVENAAARDASEDFLNRQELDYYLSL